MWPPYRNWSLKTPKHSPESHPCCLRQETRPGRTNKTPPCWWEKPPQSQVRSNNEECGWSHCLELSIACFKKTSSSFLLTLVKVRYEKYKRDSNGMTWYIWQCPSKKHPVYLKDIAEQSLMQEQCPERWRQGYQHQKGQSHTRTNSSKKLLPSQTWKGKGKRWLLKLRRNWTHESWPATGVKVLEE